jgi:hypothetical protein
MNEILASCSRTSFLEEEEEFADRGNARVTGLELAPFLCVLKGEFFK